LLGFAAVNTGNNLLFLVVAGLLAFMAATGYAGMLNIKGIIPELLPPDELFAGSPGRFRVVLRNEKKYIPSFLIRIGSSDKAETLIPFLAAGEDRETTLELVFPMRGRHRIGQVRVSSPFPVNFFTRYWNFQLDTVCLVFPQLIPLVGRPAGDGNHRFGTSNTTSRGQDGELEGIREYSGGEPLRAIHWKLSARGDDLLVKEFGSQSAPPLVIRPEALPGAGIEEKLSCAAWLVRQQVMVQPVGLVLKERNILPAIGRRHGAKLLTELALYGYSEQT
jgi:uncharacterized protein (DUF58 family)